MNFDNTGHHSIGPEQNEEVPHHHQEERTSLISESRHHSKNVFSESRPSQGSKSPPLQMQNEHGREFAPLQSDERGEAEPTMSPAHHLEEEDRHNNNHEEDKTSAEGFFKEEGMIHFHKVTGDHRHEGEVKEAEESVIIIQTANKKRQNKLRKKKEA